MKTYTNLYKKLCSKENILLAYENAKKGKSNKKSVLEFEKALEQNLEQLKQDLLIMTYKTAHLKRFIIRDPKTRVIHASAFRDRIIHHLIVEILQPVYEKIFIYDSYASRLKKGEHQAIIRFEKFKQQVSKNGLPVSKAKTKNEVLGYVLKCDIKHYFDNVDHEILLSIIKRRFKDEKLIWLIKQVLNNFDAPTKGKGMPLGNYTSQFFANVYLNELDYFVKHILKARCYIRYVDDFVILHKSKKVLQLHKERINNYLNCLNLTLHPEKSSIIPLKKGVSFLGYRIFYHYRLLRKRNIRRFKRKLEEYLVQYEKQEISKKSLTEKLQGWFGYAQWANTYKFRKEIEKRITDIEFKLKKNA